MGGGGERDDMPSSKRELSSKKDTRRTAPIFRPLTFLVAFGVVFVAPRTGRCVIVDV